MAVNSLSDQLFPHKSQRNDNILKLFLRWYPLKNMLLNVTYICLKSLLMQFNKKGELCGRILNSLWVQAGKC